MTFLSKKLAWFVRMNKKRIPRLRNFGLRYNMMPFMVISSTSLFAHKSIDWDYLNIYASTHPLKTKFSTLV
jgi:hypothetical protein